MDRLLRWVRTLAAAAAIATAALLAAAFGPTLIGMRSMIVMSGSMEPVLPLGAVALTRPVDARSVAIGDIVSFRQRGDQIATTHRVMKIDTDAGYLVFVTKGDANDAADAEPVVVAGEIDRVERIVPYAGLIVGFARSPLGGLLLLVVPIAGLSFDASRRRRRSADTADGPDDVACPHCGTELGATGTEG